MDADHIQVKELGEQINKTLHDIQAKHEETFKKYGEESAEMKAHWDSANATLDKLKDRIDGLETKASRPQVGITDGADFAKVKKLYMQKHGEEKGSQVAEDDAVYHEKAYVAFLRDGDMGLQRFKNSQPSNQKAWLLADDTSAGFLALPPMKVDEILKQVTEMSPVRELARVFTGGTEQLELTSRDSIMTAAWVGETATRSETTAPTYGLINIFAHENYVQPHASRQMLADAAFNLEAELSSEAAESMADLESAAFVSGSGVGQPTGIATSTRITHDTTDTTGVVDFDDLIDMYYAIKDRYRANATWGVNRTILGSIRKLKDGQGQHLWQPALAPAEPDTILGRPVREFSDLASTFTTGNDLVIYGDFRAGYAIYDRMGMTLLRDEITGKNSGKVEFDFFRRTGGDLRQAEALRVLEDS